METRTLQQTDLSVSRACFGTMTFGSQVDEAAAKRIVDRAIDGGVNFFDTANVYNAGVSETIVGKALAGRRDRVILASKVRGKMGDGADDTGLSRAAIHKAIEQSLRRLGTDYLDLYYLHQPDYDVRIEETLAAMDELVRAGKVRYAASSNYAAWQVTQMQAIAAQKGYRPATVTQPMYNLLARGVEPEYVPMCKELRLSMVVYNPLAGGLLTGKQKRGGADRGHAFRQQPDVPQPLLERCLLRRGERVGRDRAGGRPLDGEPGFELAAASYGDGLRDPGGIADRATGGESADAGRGPAGAGYGVGLR